MSIHVILLEKIRTLSPGCFEKDFDQDILDSWIALGHFDAIYAYELKQENKNLFQVIADNNRRIAQANSGDCYYHPLYLISPKGEQADDAFWTASLSYFAVARVHFAESVSAHASSEFEFLKAKIQQDTQDKSVLYRTYRTIELSDMILVAKANQMCDLLNFVLSLRQYSTVGKVYTYCGVNYNYIKSNKWAPDKEDTVPLFSMRFSAESMVAADHQLTQIRDTLGEEDTFSVVGVDDIAITWKSLHLQKIVMLYRNWINNTHSDALSLNKAFSEITTRVGIPFDSLQIEPSSELDSAVKLQRKCASLLEKANFLRGLVCDRNQARYDWVSPLSDLTHTLFRMSRTSILDEFVFIMLPGVDAFLNNVTAHLENLTEQDLQMCRCFVENWTHLMEHIMRVEGQLAHHPDMRPILYNIPVAMLEYTLAFLRCVVEIMQSEDKPKAQICFLLVPRLCEKIEAQELFPAEPNELPGLVLVTIPLADLYKPREVQRALCHEASHFVGEKHRSRAVRRRKYISAVAALMAKEVFGDVHPTLIQLLQSKLLKSTDGLIKCSMRYMQSEIVQWLTYIYDTPEAYYELVRDLLLCAQTSEPIDFGVSELDEIRVLRFFELLEDLSTLFREVYADICMLSLLPISNTEYVESLMSELKDDTTDTGSSDETNCYEQFAIRMYISLEATNRDIPINYIFKYDKTLHEHLHKISDGLKSEDEDPNRLIPISSIVSLLQYAIVCSKSIVAQKGNLQQCHEMFCNVSSKKMNYDEFLDAVNDYRKLIIADLRQQDLPEF